MKIKELILQGIKRFKEPVKFQLQDGLNIFYGSNEKGKTTVSDAIFFLLSLTQDKDQKTNLKSQTSKDIRLGVTFQEGPDTFRLLMDVASDAVLLSKYNQEGKKFDTVSKDVNEIKDFLRRDLLFKPLEQYKALYMLNSYALLNPYTQGPVRENESPEPFTLESSPEDFLGQKPGQFDDFGPASFGSDENVQQDNMTKEEIQTQIAKLENDLKLSAGAAAQQDKLDQLESRLTDIQNKLNTIKTCAIESDAMEKQVNELNKFSDLPEDIEKKVDEYVQFEARMKKEIENIERQRSQYTEINVTIPPFYRDKLFIAGGAVSFLFIVVPILLSIFLGSWGIYLSAGIFAGLGMMVYALWNDANKRSGIKKMQSTVSALEKQIKEQRKKYEIEGSVIMSIITSMNLESPLTLKEGLKKYREVLDQFASAKKKYNESVTEANPELLKKQEEQVKSEIENVQEQLRAMTGSGMDQYAITQEIESFKKRLKEKDADFAPQKKEPVIRKSSQQKHADTQAAPVPLYTKYLTTMAELIGDSRERIVSLVSTKASSYFSTLTKGAFQEISLPGNKIALIQSSGKELAFDNLSGSAKEKCMFSIFLSMIELAAEKWPWPVVMDEPFAIIDESNRQSAYTIIKSFSKETQVLLLTKDGSIKPLADAFITL